MTHLSRFQWNATKAPFFHGWLTLAPSCLNPLSFPWVWWEHVGVIKEIPQSGRHSLAFLLDILCGFLQIWWRGKLWLCWDFLERSHSPHQLLIISESYGSALEKQTESEGWGALMKPDVSLFVAMHACWVKRCVKSRQREKLLTAECNLNSSFSKRQTNKGLTIKPRIHLNWTKC